MSKPKISIADFCRAAKVLRCDVAAIRAVAEVESREEGFYASGFPVILFERHKFRQFTNGRYNQTHPDISGPAGNYGAAGQNQRNKFNKAFALDPKAAMKACSWGKFQIMGFNHEEAGFRDVGSFVDAMKESEGRQLDAFVAFVKSNGLTDELRNHDWKSFARGYNGAGYAKNRYDTKMATAYKKFSKENIDCSKDSAAAPSVQSASSDIPNAYENNEEIPATPPPPMPTVEVQKESPSLFVKIGAALTAIGGFGLNVGSLVQSKLEELTAYQIGFLIAALGVAALGIWWYRSAAKGANQRTMQLVDKAADPATNNVVLTK